MKMGKRWGWDGQLIGERARWRQRKGPDPSSERVTTIIREYGTIVMDDYGSKYVRQLQAVSASLGTRHVGGFCIPRFGVFILL
jgi:hypothetical protein